MTIIHTHTHTPHLFSVELKKYLLYIFSIWVFTLNKNTNRFYLIDLTNKCTTSQYNIPHTCTRYVYSLHAIYMQPKIIIIIIPSIRKKWNRSMHLQIVTVESCSFLLRLRWITAFGSWWIYFQSQSSVIPVPRWMDLPQVAWTSRRTIQRRFVNYPLNWAKKQLNAKKIIFASWLDFFLFCKWMLDIITCTHGWCRAGRFNTDLSWACFFPVWK